VESEKKNTNELTCRTKTDSDVENKLMVTKEDRSRGGMDSGFGFGTCTLRCNGMLWSIGTCCVAQTCCVPNILC